MRNIRELLRLRHECGLSQRAVGACLGLGRSTVKDYLDRAKKQGLAWPLPPDCDDGVLENRLFNRPAIPHTNYDVIDYEYLDKESRKKHVTLSLLWYEHRKTNPNGLSYSQFCHRFRNWKARQDLVMRQTHRAGEKLFVDYAGTPIEVEIEKGKVRQAQIFVAVLGASNYTYAEATWTQSVEDWIASHVRAFEFLGGVPELVIPDNLKSGVTKPSRYEPEIQTTYADMARHYQTAIMPARVRRPKDKAKAEQGVLLVQRWIGAALRHRRFHSLADLNRAIADLLDILNRKTFKKMSGNRQQWYESLDRPALKALPAHIYELSYWAIQRVGLDYHVPVKGHHYSVPHHLVNQEVDIRYTTATVEVFFKNRRVAVHARSGSTQDGLATTLREHMPKKHQAIADWTPVKARAWASKIGPSTLAVVETLLAKSKHLLIGLQACSGFDQLDRGFGSQRLEAACRRAIAIQGCSYTSIKSILEHGLDRRPLEPAEEEPQVADHPNVRGPAYYGAKEGAHAAPSNP